MLFSGKENVFMCLVAFQKNFWKIFSGVWRRRRKRQIQTNPDEGEDSAISIFARSRSYRSSIDERCDHAVDCDLSRRAAWSTSALVGQSHRSSIAPLDDWCSPIWALSSLSLSLFPKMIWSENEGVKSFPGQRWKFRSTGSHFPENEIYRCYQTPRFRGKWFLEIIFPQNKRTLKQHYTYFYTLFHSHVFQKTTNNNSQTILPNTPLEFEIPDEGAFLVFGMTNAKYLTFGTSDGSALKICLIPLIAKN